MCAGYVLNESRTGFDGGCRFDKDLILESYYRNLSYFEKPPRSDMARSATVIDKALERLREHGCGNVLSQ